MKDATGELSMTAIAVVAIAAIALLFQQLIWPGIQATIQRNTYCSQAFNCKCTSNSGTCSCSYYEGDNIVNNLQCPNNQKKLSPAASNS